MYKWSRLVISLFPLQQSREITAQSEDRSFFFERVCLFLGLLSVITALSPCNLAPAMTSQHHRSSRLSWSLFFFHILCPLPSGSSVHSLEAVIFLYRCIFWWQDFPGGMSVYHLFVRVEETGSHISSEPAEYSVEGYTPERSAVFFSRVTIDGWGVRRVRAPVLWAIGVSF